MFGHGGQHRIHRETVLPQQRFENMEHLVFCAIMSGRAEVIQSVIRRLGVQNSGGALKGPDQDCALVCGSLIPVDTY